ncbi:MAG: MXAN_6577-like cysteine-rich protein [Polyangiales bacterium]
MIARFAPLLLALAVFSACSTDDWEFCPNHVCPGAYDASVVACPEGLTLCSAFCRDTRTDESNCGGCGVQCTSTQVCQQSRCTDVTGCATPRTMCGESCIDTTSDNANCGACGVACPVGTACSGGRCVCPVGQALCGGSCVNTQTDGANCGGCNTRCATGQVCGNGQCLGSCPAPRTLCGSSCTSVSSDIGNCGRCGNRCASGQLCTGGACVTPCPAPSMVCSGACTDVTTDLVNCGRCGNRCATGQVCTGGACATPSAGGMAGSPCTRDSDCGSAGRCIAAGLGFPGGYCYYGCPLGSTPGDPCALGTGICLGVAGVTQNICFRGCTPGTSNGCRTGYVCLDVSSDHSTGVCFPNCTQNPGAVCGPDRCDTTTGACVGSCTSNEGCSRNSVCEVTSRTCYCTTGTDFGANLRCYVPPGGVAGACGCASSAACPVGRTCNTDTGVCL